MGSIPFSMSSRKLLEHEMQEMALKIDIRSICISALPLIPTPYID